MHNRSRNCPAPLFRSTARSSMYLHIVFSLALICIRQAMVNYVEALLSLPFLLSTWHR